MNGEVSSVEMEVSSRPLIPDVSSRAGVLIRWRDGLRHRGVLEGWMTCASHLLDASAAFASSGLLAAVAGNASGLVARVKDGI